jgi:hypothetical protein
VNPYRRRPPGGRSPHDRTNGIRHMPPHAMAWGGANRRNSQDVISSECIADNILVAQACTRALHTGA